jgi:hypothetical protein
MLWTTQYGSGRVFVTTLGHGPDEVRESGFGTTFARGAEWAATGKVTLPIPPAFAATASPKFRVDPSWPKIPNGWQFGQVSSVSIDADDHVWVLQRPGTLAPEEKSKAAPPVLEFTADGTFVRAWGGPGKGYEWPSSEHGIYVDPKGFVWIGGNGTNDHQILKFRKDGSFVMQIGHAGKSRGNADTENLNQPADAFVLADVFLLTDVQPKTLPAPTGDGLFLEHNAEATDQLLSDLRSDAGMAWVPEEAWLTKILVSTPAEDLKYDLAVDHTGKAQPSRVAAGLDLPVGLPQTGSDSGGSSDPLAVLGWAVLTAAVLTIVSVILAPRFGRGR